jgi:hypothetical protein
MYVHEMGVTADGRVGESRSPLLSSITRRRAMHDHQQRSTNSSPTPAWRSAGLFAVRYGIGGIMIVAGVVALVSVGGEVGTHGFSMAVGAGLAVMLLNLLYRVSVSGDQERAREEEARRYFDEHGVWPVDEEPQRRFRGRGWTLPLGAVTPEQEQREGSFAGDRRPAATGAAGR